MKIITRKTATIWSILSAVCLLFITGMVEPVQAEVVGKNVPYEHDGVKLEGYLAWDDATNEKRPGILVVHEWWGLNDYARRRADQLAELGYVAFALDMYGAGKATTHPEKASEWMKQVNQNIERWRARAMAGLEVLKNDLRTDPSRLGAIGYCFGGATVQQLAYSGADIEGVASFHGSLITPPENVSANVKAAILICHGAADPMAPVEKVGEYLDAMGKSGLRWQMEIYGGAKHSFTNPDADKAGMAALGYDPNADAASWETMKDFFDREFSD